MPTQFLMDSLKTATILKCGHAIHTQCQEDLLQSGNPRCPICNSSFLNMKRQWKYLDEIIARSPPMPVEYRNWTVEILCADCHEKSQALFHFEGLKCGACGGYNTTRCGSEEPPKASAAAPGEEGHGGAAGGGAGEGAAGGGGAAAVLAAENEGQEANEEEEGEDSEWETEDDDELADGLADVIDLAHDPHSAGPGAAPSDSR